MRKCTYVHAFLAQLHYVGVGFSFSLCVCVSFSLLFVSLSLSLLSYLLLPSFLPRYCIIVSINASTPSLCRYAYALLS